LFSSAVLFLFSYEFFGLILTFLFFGAVKIIHRFQKSSSFSKELSAAKIISFVF
jgi:hypothetical protein